MKTPVIIGKLVFLFLLSSQTGCEPAALAPSNNCSNLLAIYAPYAPVKIDIMPLTEVVFANGAQGASQLKVYVSLVDSFDCQRKTPGMFRLELYEYVQRSADPKGRRVVVWPDIDLTDAAKNNEYWRDFFRAYEFNLDFTAQRKQSYILQVTCFCPNGKRLSNDFLLEHPK